LKLRKWEGATARQLAEIEINMAPYIGKQEGVKERIKFPKCEINNCALELEFRLVEADANQGADDSGDEEVKDTDRATFPSTNVDVKGYEDEINQLKK
jgi:hypothetical protein